MNLNSSVAAIGFTLTVGAMAGCYDDAPARPVQPAQSGGSTVVVTDPKPAPAAPQPAPVINNVVQPAPVQQPAAAPTGGTTVNVQPKTVNVP